MPAEAPDIQEEPDEQELCVSCMATNVPGADFCAMCGAPLTSYAATGPIEKIFAEGFIYRQASDRPRKFIILLGVWMIFGPLALISAFSVFVLGGLEAIIFGIFLLVSSLAMLWRTTWNYFSRKPDGCN